MADILGTLGGLGGLNPPIQQSPGSPYNPEQQQMLRDYAKALLARNQSVNLPGNSHPYRLASPLQGVADMLNTLAGRRMYGSSFGLQNANVAGAPNNPAANPNPPATPPPAAPMGLGMAPPIDPNSSPAQGYFNDAPEGGADNNTPQTQPVSNPSPAPRNNRPSNSVGDHVYGDFNYFRNQGFDTHQAAALAYRRQQESGNNYGAVNPGDGSDRSDSIGGMQWNGPRAQALVRFARDRGVVIPQGSNSRQVASLIPPDIQRAFVVHELNTSENGPGEALRNARDPQAAYRAVLGYVRPRNQNISQADLTAINAIAQGGNNQSTNVASNDLPSPTNLPPPPTVNSFTPDAANAPPNAPPFPGRMNVGAPPPPPEAQSNVTQVQNAPAPNGSQNDQSQLPPVYNPQLHFPAQNPPPRGPLAGLTTNEQAAIAGMPQPLREMRLNHIQYMNTPQWTESTFGRRWVIPATGQSGWIPTPQHDTMNIPGFGPLPVIHIYSEDGRRQTYLANPTPERPNSGSNSQPAPNAPPGRSNLGVPPPPEAQSTITPTQDNSSRIEQVSPAPTDPNAQLPPNTTDVPINRPETPPVAQQTPPVAQQTPPVAQQTPPAAQQTPPAAQQTPPATTAPPNTPNWWSPSLENLRQFGMNLQTQQQEREGMTANHMAVVKDAIETGNMTPHILGMFDVLENAINSPGAENRLFGPQNQRWVNIVNSINGMLQAVGRPPLIDPQSTGVNASQIIEAITTRLASRTSHELTNRPTQFDFIRNLQAMGGNTADPRALRIMLDIMRQTTERDRLVGLAANNLQPGQARDLTRIREQIYNEHPITYQGNTLRNMNQWRFNPQTGEFAPTVYTNGMVVNGRRLNVPGYDQNQPVPANVAIGRNNAHRWEELNR